MPTVDDIRSTEVDKRVSALRSLIQSGKANAFVAEEVERLMGDRACARLSIPLTYGEIRVLAAEAYAAIGGARIVELSGVPRSLSEDKMIPLAKAADIPRSPRLAPVRRYRVLRDAGGIPRQKYLFLAKGEARPDREPAIPAHVMAMRGDHPADRIAAIEAVIAKPRRDQMLAAELRRLMGDRECGFLPTLGAYGEIRLLAAEALAAVRSALGDGSFVALKDVPKAMTRKELEDAGGSELSAEPAGVAKAYEALRDEGKVERADRIANPASYGDLANTKPSPKFTNVYGDGPRVHRGGGASAPTVASMLATTPAGASESEGTRYFVVGARPAKFVPTATGGLDVLAFDWDSGDFVRDIALRSRIMSDSPDVDEVDRAGFEKALTAARKRHASRGD